ncbi:hypothetical protein [Rhodoferax sp. GW822-FHT02A01]|uniref:phage tail assembly chaperone n=1 Tax=Rhodoferax sp. GW822-FHT02A01 TaxID=3141537 RepID=UPI00315D3296
MVPELHIPPPKNGCWHIWETFIELHNARGAGMGPSPITWRDLSAWQEVRGVVLTPWEIDTLTALDQVAMKSMNEKKP